MSNKTPEDLAAEAGERGTFSFIERLQGRSYAKDDVVVNLDEELGFILIKLQDKLHNTPELDAEQVTALESKIDQVIAQLSTSAYILHMHGISNEEHDDLVAEARAAHKYEYDYVENPFTGQKTRELKDNPDRNEMFTRLIWRACIDSIEDAEGNIDSDISDAWIDALLKRAPQAVIGKIAETIEKLRVSTDWIDATQDEDFLAKP